MSQEWTALSGVSGVALACCFLGAAVVLRWTGRRTARGAVARARQRQRAGLETMDKAVQRFRLQVKEGSGAGVGWLGRGSTFCLEARGPTGRLRGCELWNRTPLRELVHLVLFQRQVQREEKRKRKGQDRWWRQGAVLVGSKRSFALHKGNLDYYQNATK